MKGLPMDTDAADAISTLERELDAVTRDRDAGRTVYLTIQQSAAVLASRFTAAEAKAARMGEALKAMLQRFELYAGPNDIHAGHHDLELLKLARSALQSEKDRESGE